MRKRMSSWAAFCTIVGWICVVVGLGAALFTRFSTLGVALAGISSLFFAACLEWMDGVLEYLYEIREQQKTMTEYVYAQAMGLKIDREERREREAQERAAQEAQADPQPTQRRRRTEHPGGFDAE